MNTNDECEIPGMKNSVRLEDNGDGTYSAYIYDSVVFTGSYYQCEESLRSHCPGELLNLL